MMDGWMDGWMGGWVGGWVDGWVDGWMDLFLSDSLGRVLAGFKLAGAENDTLNEKAKPNLQNSCCVRLAKGTAQENLSHHAQRTLHVNKVSKTKVS